MHAMAILVIALSSTMPASIRDHLQQELQTTSDQLIDDGQPTVGRLCKDLAIAMGVPAPKKN